MINKSSLIFLIHQLALILSVLSFLNVSVWAQENIGQDTTEPPFRAKVWQTGANMQGGRMVAPQDQRATPPIPGAVKVPLGGSLPCQVEAVEDLDHWTQGNHSGEDKDTITYNWTCVDTGEVTAGHFGAANHSSTYWTAPQTAGSYTLKCTINDAPKGISATDSGTRDDDTSIVRLISVVVTPSHLIVSAASDHLDADGTSTTDISVRLTDENNNPRAGVAVNLTVTDGTLQHASMVTDANGDGVVDSDEDGVADAGEPRKTLLTASSTGGRVQVIAIGGGEQGQKTVLFHQVKVTNFSQPHLLKYQVNSSDLPTMAFRVGDQPAVAMKFEVTISIFTTNNLVPIATKKEVLSPGNYTRSWSDFFELNAEDPQRLPYGFPSGLYPYQIEAKVHEVDAAVVGDIANQNCMHADWKSSKTLTIDWTYKKIYFNESTNTRMIRYDLILTNHKCAAPPVESRIDIYDPDQTVIKTVPLTWIPRVGQPGWYDASGDYPIELSKAGDYHFIVEARQRDVLEEGKDRGKWAIEQNQAANRPTIATFGFRVPGIADSGIPGVLDTRYGAERASSYLQDTIGYAKSTPKNRQYYHPNKYGYLYQNDVGAAVGVTEKAFGGDHREQTMQYNPVWIFLGHGTVLNKPSTGNRIGFYVGDPSSTSSSYEDATHTWLHASLSSFNAHQTESYNKRCLSQLPDAWTPVAIPPNIKADTKVKPLYNSRLIAFFGCNTALNPENPAWDLPSMAVSKGARSAIGVEGYLQNDQLNRVAWELTKWLSRKRSVSQAADKASEYADFDRVKTGAYPGRAYIHVYGDKRTFVDEALWGRE